MADEPPGPVGGTPTRKIILPSYLYLLSSGRVGTFGLAAFAVTTFMLSMINAELVKALFPLAKH